MKLKLIFLLFFNLLVVAAFLLYYLYFYRPYLPSRSAVLASPAALKISCSPVCLKIAIFTDVHASWDKLKEAVKLANESNFDAVINLGDLTKLGEPEELAAGKKILNNLKIPYYFTPGNHDLWYSRRFDLDPDYYWRQVFGGETAPACLTKNGFNLVFLNDANEKEKLIPEEWQKLLDCLEVNQPALLFTHEPLYHPVNERVMGQYSDRVATQAAQLKDLLCQKKLKLVVAGHLHNFAKYFYPCPDGYKLPMLIVGALTSDRNFQSPRFLELTVFEDGSFEEKERVLDK